MSKLVADKVFGKTGYKVPSIVYGTSYLGNLYTALDENTKLEIVKKWFECTETPVFIDSAGKYGAGLALEMIGKLLKKLNISPNDIVISNKLGWYRIPLTTPEPTFEPGAWADIKNDAVQKISYQGIIDCWEQGCELLGSTYRAQLVSVHDPDEYLAVANTDADYKQRLDDVLGAYKALFELKDRGEVKAVGIGSKDWKVIKMLSEHVDFDWVMFANSFTLLCHPKEIIDFIEKLQEKKTGIINSAVFNAGFLTGGEYFDYQKVDPDSDLGKRIYSWRERFFALCSKYNVNAPDACIQFGISHPAISSIALNTSKPGKMNRNVDTITRKIPVEFWAAMKQQGLIASDYPYV
ncbi:MAG: aldo/keto reductase [Bacteroidales bacterium]|nr:aldo/keto reductase [Bacteroidales bacterium]